MRSFYQGPLGRVATYLLSLASAGVVVSCQSPAGQASPDERAVATDQQALSEDMCGFGQCDSDALAHGVASISGVPSVDAFFQAVLDFKSKANSTSDDIDAQLAAIRADFGIDANADLAAALKARIALHATLLKIDAEPARCTVDAQATLKAEAKCDVSVDPGSAMVECKGSCEVDASADVKCDANADLQCTVVAPSIQCMGECKGRCDVDVSAGASCTGTCEGTCEGTCSAYAMGSGGSAQCAGTCSGTCKGHCKTELAAGASCSGKCEGECTVTNPSAGCTGGIHAECKAKADAMVSCKGRCTGEFNPPKASAECEANARAQAKLNVECTPPRVSVHLQPMVTLGLSGVDLTARLRFIAAAKNLEVRLPRLLASLERAKSMTAAYTDLADSGETAIKAVVNAAQSGNLRVKVGLLCASGQVLKVGAVVKDSAAHLKASADGVVALSSALSM